MPAVTIKIRRGTSIEWNSSTKPLASGELGLDTTLNKIKAGNGTSLWPALSFISVIPSEIYELSQDAIDLALVAGTGLTKTYNDNANTITLTVDNTIANKLYVDTVVAALGNTASETYVPVNLVGNPEGVASLDINGKIPDSEIPSTIARDSEVTTAISTAISSLIDSSPAALNTLNELAAAINDDASYAATITTALGTKVDSNYVAIGNTLLEGISGQTYGLIGTSAYLDVKDSNGYNKEIELDIAAVETKLAADGFAKLDSPTFTGTVILPTNTIRSSDLTWEMYSAESQLPNPGVKHGMFAHVHGTGGAYFAHSGAWRRLALMDEPSVDYYITNSGTGSYLVNGVSNGTINFIKGKKYRIIVNAVGHPFRIQTVPGAYSSQDAYSTGITNVGTDNGSIIVELPQNAPDNLYYACEFHSSMAGSINSYAVEPIKIEQQAQSYTILSTDAAKIIEMPNGGNITISDSTSFPVGFSVDILQTGTGQVTIIGDGFTPNATPGLKLRTQWSSATLLKRGSNSWVVLGDLAV